MKLEAIALGETISYVINSPFTIGDKVMDVMAEFGFKKEQKAKEADPAGGRMAAGAGNARLGRKSGKTGKKNGKKNRGPREQVSRCRFIL